LLLGQGVKEAEGLRMEKDAILSLQAAFLAVFALTEERVPRFREMDSDLIAKSGFEFNLHQSGLTSLHPFQNLPVGDGVPGSRLQFGHRIHPKTSVFGKKDALKRTGVLGKKPRYGRDIPPIDGVSRELSDQFLLHALRSSVDQQSRDHTIESVNGQHFSRTPTLTENMKEVVKGVAAGFGCTVGEKPGFLVDDHETSI
jgi:hypothetical protein